MADVGYSFRVGGVARGARSIPETPAPVVAFSPTDLGTNLRNNPRKGNTRHQDSARTTLVTASGQPVGGWTDSASVALHPLQSSAGARPLEAAGRDGAVFDGAKFLVTPNLGAFAADFFVGMVLTPATLAAGYVRFLERVGSGGGVYLGTASGLDLVAFVNGTPSTAVAFNAGVKHWIALARIGTTARLYVDSATAAQTWSVSSAAIPDAPTIIGGPDGSGALYDGIIHEYVIAKDVTGGDVTNLLAYMATV